MRLNGKVALISGGARGMGAAHARALVAAGAKVVIADLLDELGQALARELGPERALYVHLDVSRLASWRAAVEATTQRFGTLNVLVNNAGIINQGSLLDYTEDDWNSIIAVNLTGQFLGIKAAAAALIESAPASIINISSTAGMQGVAQLHGYTASKFGVRGLTKSVALELAGRNVRANSIHPGTVATPLNEGLDVTDFNPMNRLGEPAEISSMVVYLASDEASFVTGAEFVMDGGELAGMGPLKGRQD
ncbi:glucose 1-dehydrogenase [Pseudomonas typographi]|nr:glucose 1-dehydrogenase [Pseudomonas typographi]